MKNKAYAPPESDQPIRLGLNRNETQCLNATLDQLSLVEQVKIEKYPSQLDLQSSIADWIEIESERIVISAGGDEGIERVIRHSLTPAKSVVLTHSPSFEMFDIYTHNAGGNLKSVQWLNESFPTGEFLDQIDETTGLCVLVSPNNPTGRIIPLETIETIAERCKENNINLLLDCAYIEFADENVTARLAKLPNIIMVRTFSKAWGMAGLRVGYLICPSSQLADELRALAGPFPVSGVSLDLAQTALENGRGEMEQQVSNIKSLRPKVVDLLCQAGGNVLESQANFVFCEFDDADLVWNRLAEQGISIRKFDRKGLENGLRITIPTNISDLFSLAKAVAEVTNLEIDESAFLPQVFIDQLSQPIEEQASSPANMIGKVSRKTKETNIEIEVNLYGEGKVDISTGLGFFDHMLTALAFHSRMDLKLHCDGDLYIDDHHTVEDCALALGSAMSDLLGDRKGIQRFGYAYAPLDEGLARTVIDLSGRPWPQIDLKLKRDMIGEVASENLVHFFQSLAMTLKCSLHVDVLRGDNDHHKAEAAFKSLALALRGALTPNGNQIPSTKGVL